ncbi:uncharacterized protein LOC129394366, partial [Pan paniscus]|uniref:uncharacterized protein LOC129394366 n=1 Tax=Pan paniscus TaxID=9597 RepID=UPI002436B6F6
DWGRCQVIESTLPLTASNLEQRLLSTLPQAPNTSPNSGTSPFQHLLQRNSLAPGSACSPHCSRKPSLRTAGVLQVVAGCRVLTDGSHRYPHCITINGERTLDVECGVGGTRSGDLHLGWSALRMPSKGTAWSTSRSGLCARVDIAADGETFGVAEECPQTLEGIRCLLHSRVSLPRAIISGSRKSGSWARAGWSHSRGAALAEVQAAPVSQAAVSDASLVPEGSQEVCRPGLTSRQHGGRDGR